MFTCTPCNCNFKDQAGLDHHLQLSLAHAFDCKPCGQASNSWELLGIHCESTLHQRMMNSPLNAFFRSWSGFLFHAQLPPHRNWDELRKFCCWDDQSPQYRAAWIQYQDALASEVTIWFGDVLELESWHKLCGAVGISPLPSTCADGYWAIRDLHVNIIDLIQWARTGSNGEVKRWRNNAALFEYSIATKKIFERDLTTRDNPNVVLRHLASCMLPR
ncbi:hypothetical protein LT330_000768 [Penicillium expansum]|nr:hypothetical protein LT330_000768 [Penicillium expansum]